MKRSSKLSSAGYEFTNQTRPMADDNDGEFLPRMMKVSL